MKKLRLKALDLGAREILTREQLKKITGGSCTSALDCDMGQYCTSHEDPTNPNNWIDGECVNSGPTGGGPGSDGTGSGVASNTCGTVWNPDLHAEIPLCPQYSAAGHLFVGCVPCDVVI
jgi:hypothetical protein